MELLASTVKPRYLYVSVVATPHRITKVVTQTSSPTPFIVSTGGTGAPNTESNAGSTSDCDLLIKTHIDNDLNTLSIVPLRPCSTDGQWGHIIYSRPGKRATRYDRGLIPRIVSGLNVDLGRGTPLRGGA